MATIGTLAPNDEARQAPPDFHREMHVAELKKLVRRVLRRLRRWLEQSSLGRKKLPLPKGVPVVFGELTIPEQEEALDLLQPKLCRWARRGGSLNRGALCPVDYESVRAVAHRALRNLAFDAIDKRRRRDRGNATYYDRGLAPRLAVVSPLDELLAEEERAEARGLVLEVLQAAQAALTPVERLILFRHTIDGKTCREIAGEINLPIDQVKRIARRALRKTRESMTPGRVGLPRIEASTSRPKAA